jgi:DNA transformation protein
MSNSGFVEHIMDILSRFSDIRLYRMFGGYGIYRGKIIFAIIIDDELYFKVDVKLAEEYKNAGSFPFTYKRDDKTIALSYWYVPSEVIEDRDLLKEWFNKSLGVAISQNIGKQEDQKIK